MKKLRFPCGGGRWVDIFDLQPDDFRIEEIAHALACTNRFYGQLREPISVAQHSVYVSWLCPTLQALLHDAGEAFYGDVSKWIKEQPEMEWYRTQEKMAQRRCYKAFGCLTEEPPELKAADKLMVRFEADYGYTRGIALWEEKGYGPLTEAERAQVEGLSPGGYYPWSWQRTEAMFLGRFKELQGGGPPIEDGWGQVWRETAAYRS